MLIGTEVGLVEHGVGIEDAHDADAVEVEALGDHLCADEQVGASGREVADDALVGIARAGGVEVHACHAGLWEDVAQLVLDLLRAIAPPLQFLLPQAGTLGRDPVGVAAVVAGQLVHGSVERERDVAVLAAGHPSALLALNHRGVAAAVLEEDGLLAALQGLSDTRQQQRREGAVHHLAPLQVSDVYHLYLGQLHALVPLLQLHQSVLARHGVVVGSPSRGGGTEQNVRRENCEACHHDGHAAGMIAGHGVLLLVAGLVLLVDDDEAQALEGQEHGRAGTEDDVVGVGRQLFLPDLHALGIAVFGVVDAQTVAEDAAQTVHHLHGQRNLGQEVEHLAVLVQLALYEVDVYLGLAARSHAVQQRHGLLHHGEEDLVVGLLLGARSAS